MRLELDAGNSRIKWRLFDGHAYVLSGADLKGQLNLNPEWKKDVNVAWLSSVHPEQTRWVQANFDHVQCAETQQRKFGLENSYQDVSKMGVDRWLAMLAAWDSEPGKQHLVIDAGTAITLEVINEKGQHMGGYICPGLGLMKSALLGKTQQVHAEQNWRQARQPGCSTQECVDHGILDMTISWLESHIQRYPQAKVWLTGGDSQLMLNFLRELVVCEPDLVLNGLTRYFNDKNK